MLPPLLNPVPSRPDPSRPVTRERESDCARPENGELSLGELERIGFTRFGQLGGKWIAKLSRFAPVAQWEWDAICKTDGNSWAYALKVLENIRAESDKPQAPSAGKSPPRKMSRKDEEIANAFAAADAYNERIRNGGE